MRPPAFWLSLSGNTRGAIWFLAAAVSFSGMAVCVKMLGRTMSVWEMSVLRSLVALVVLSPILFRPGANVWKTRHFGTHVLRSALGGLSSVLALLRSLTSGTRVVRPLRCISSHLRVAIYESLPSSNIRVEVRLAVALHIGVRRVDILIRDSCTRVLSRLTGDSTRGAAERRVFVIEVP